MGGGTSRDWRRRDENAKKGMGNRGKKRGELPFPSYHINLADKEEKGVMKTKGQEGRVMKGGSSGKKTSNEKSMQRRGLTSGVKITRCTPRLDSKRRKEKTSKGRRNWAHTLKKENQKTARKKSHRG